MLQQRLIRTSALHRRTGEVILWIQLPLNNTYNRYTIPIILLQIDKYHSIILLQIQLPPDNVYFQSTHDASATAITFADAITTQH